MPEADEMRERRKSVLLDSDLDRIGEAFDRRLTSFCEKIGYDVTTPESRAAIRDDHSFVRNFRKRAGWIITTIVGAAIVSGVAAAFGVK